jgi:hypothetical protein
MMKRFISKYGFGEVITGCGKYIMIGGEGRGRTGMPEEGGRF